MNNILKLQKATNKTLGVITCKVPLKQNEAGPVGFLGHALISSDKITIPHIDYFKVVKNIYDKNNIPQGEEDKFNVEDKQIVLSGNTKEYTVKVYGDDVLDSLKEYFLKNPTREGIQYLIWQHVVSDTTVLDMLIPGVVYDEITGEALCYLNTYEADDHEDIYLELPYNANPEDYEIDYEYATRTGNIITLTSINTKQDITISHGSSEATFTVYPPFAFTNSVEQELSIKSVNEFGDYIIASGVKDEIYSGLALIEKKTTTIERQQTETPVVVKGEDGKLKIEWQTRVYFTPSMFHTLINDTPSEQVENITPSIYKVPAAFVNINEEKKFMVNVLGISVNKIE